MLGLSNKAKEFISDVIKNGTGKTTYNTIKFLKCWNNKEFSDDTHYVCSYDYKNMEVFLLFHKELYNVEAECISYFIR